MKVGIVGPTYQERSLPFDAQRSVNLYPVFDQMGKEVAAMYSTPGLDEFVSAGTGPVRGTFCAANGRAFFVSGSTLYEMSSTGTATSRGTLDNSSGIVTIDENGVQLGICDGVNVYMFTYATNAFVKVTDIDLPPSGSITFIDSYFVVNKINTGSFYLSGIYDGTSWNSLDFATAESSPDDLLRVLNGVGQLWLFGTQTTEVWTNTGASEFPFERISGAKLETGILSPFTAVAIGNTVLWVGRDKIGQGIVYKARGFSPQRISTDAIELRIQEADDLANIRAFTYQEDGHTFYVITGGGLETTLVYDMQTELWHERAYLNEFGEFEQHLGCCGMFAFGKQFVGSRVDGSIYEMSLDFYSDDGNPLARERTYTHLSDEGKRIRYNSLEIGFETGVGTQFGQGQNPVCMFQLSKDGGRTWSEEYTTPIGAVGKYQTKVSFRRLGITEQMTFRIKVTDPVKVAICGSYLF